MANNLVPGANMSLDIVAAAQGMQGEYTALAAEYVIARQNVVRTIGSEAMLLGQAAVDDPASHEVVAFRIDGIVATADDNRYDFVSRARLLATPVRSVVAPPANLIVPEAVKLHQVLPKPLASAARAFGTAGMYVQGIEYRTATLNELGGPMPIAKSSMIQIAHNGVVYAANPNEGEATRFPHLPGYKTIVSEAYGAFCATKADTVPATAELARRLAVAAEQDRQSAGKPPQDDLPAYRQLLADCPPGMEDKIKALTSALYALESAKSESLPPELAAILMDPFASLAAELALLSKWSYMRQISGRNYTAPLTEQLRQIRDFGPEFHKQMQAAVSGDAAGFESYIADKLGQAQDATQRAKSFAKHLSVPETFSLTGSEWRVRAR
jgi:hypothetical protein